MSKNRIRFWLLFVFAILLLLANMWAWFAMLNKPTANTECHNENNTLQQERRGASIYGQEKPFQSSTYWHRYTCNRYPNDEDKLSEYCQKESNSISARDNTKNCNHPGLSCHICVCNIWYKTAMSYDWTPRCCKAENIDPKTNKCCSSEDKWFSPDSDPDCIAFNKSKTPINWNETEPEEPKQDEPKKAEDCEIKDSQWKCCKKIYYDLKLEREVCCEWVLLSTNVPFIWQCIVFKKHKDHNPEAWLLVDEETAFPVLMWWVSKIMVSLILLTGFLWILVWGVMIAAAGAGDSKKWKKIIWNVISALALLGASGVILHLINPNFFW